MKTRIAVHPDRVVHKTGEIQSFSSHWEKMAAKYDVEMEYIDAYSDSSLEQLRNFDAFMWRFPPDANVCRFAHRFMNAVEFGMGKPVFPDWRTRWHTEDKIAQILMLQAAGFPVPDTRVLWSRDEAVRYLENAQYPLVLKLASGFQSRNVRLLHDLNEGMYFVDKLFGMGVASLAYAPANKLKSVLRSIRLAKNVLRGQSPHNVGPEREIHQGYVYVQEFVPGNERDTRVTVVGDRAFAFQRKNRPGDFRASGSGLVDLTPDNIPPAAIELAFRVSEYFRSQTVAIDVIFNAEKALILELTLTYSGHYVRNCPGHWRRDSENCEQFEWVPGSVDPEDVIFDDFLGRLSLRG